MIRHGYDVAGLTRVARIRCRPHLFFRSRSTFDQRFSSRNGNKPQAGQTRVKNEAKLGERGSDVYKRVAEYQDYELAKRIQRFIRRKSVDGQSDEKSRRRLPSLNDRRSFRKNDIVAGKTTAGAQTHTTKASSAGPSNASSPSNTPYTLHGVHPAEPDTGGSSSTPLQPFSTGITSSSSTQSEAATASSSTPVAQSAPSSSSTQSSSTMPTTPESPSAPPPPPSGKGKEKAQPESDHRRNPAGVQLLSHSLHRQLFPGQPLPQPSESLINLSRDHLAANGLNAKDAAKLTPVNFDLPAISGSNIRDHFHAIGRQEAEPYLSMAKSFANAELPPMPQVWATECSGWVKYMPDGSYEPVKDLGDEEVVSFDVEVLYKISPYPVIATAATPNAWYSWLCPTIFEEAPETPIPEKERWDRTISSHLPHDLIPLFEGRSKERLVLGHNVGYDRARIKDEYDMEASSIRFIDTLSLHVATRGITSVQRPAWMRHKKDKNATKLEERTFREATLEALRELSPEWAETLSKNDEGSSDEPEESPVSINQDDGMTVGPRWEDVTSVNSLKEVAALHCGHVVDKTIRDTFGDETITHASQLREELQDLVKYCADDVKITHDVYKKVFPSFIESCPHPVSFAGALNMGSAILPVDEQWGDYLKSAEGAYRKMEEEVSSSLRALAEKLRLEGPTEGDPWHAQLDWRPKKARWSEIGEDAPQAAREAREAAIALVDASKAKLGESFDVTTSAPATESSSLNEDDVQHDVAESEENPQPEWLTSLTQPNLEISNVLEKVVIPLLLRITFKGYPVVYLKEHLWCFRVPKDSIDLATLQSDHDEPVSLGEADPEVFSTWTNDFVFFRLAPIGKSRQSKLTGARSKSLVQKGQLLSPYSDLLQTINDGKATGILPDIPKLAQTVFDLGAEDPNFVQLNGLYAGKQKAKTKGLKNSDTSGTTETWPTWYHDLTKPTTQLPPGELDLTQKKSVTPLLLKLQWDGYPLIMSKTFKWLYRVPVADVSNRGYTSDGLVVGFGAPVSWDETAKDGDEMLQEDQDHFYFRLPHSGGEGKNVGNPLAKGFVKFLESGKLAATKIGDDDVTSKVAAGATKMNVLCSYWVSARERIMEQMVVYNSPGLGFILPQVVTMGTVTRRAVESTWLTASNAKKNRVGSELKAMVKAPKGYALVGADVDSEELWISSVMGDSQFGMHGATAIGWMTLEGTKSAGTDLHSKTAKILGTSRDAAKVFNYSRIYGAGVKHAVQLLMQGDATLTKDAATEKAKALYAATKGEKSMRNRQLSLAPAPSLWHGGSESFLFNTLEVIALSDRPTTPALGCGVTKALSRSYLEAINEYLPSRVNWVVQSSGVDYLHLLIVSMSYLIKRYNINARYLISVHDEVRYLVAEEDKYRTALALQIANAWTRALFCYNLGMDDVPQGVTFFSAVDIDHVLRKEVHMPCVTPSHPTEIPSGESLDIDQLLDITRTLGEPTNYNVDPSYIPQESTEPPVTLFPNIKSSTHFRFLQAQSERQSARAKWWLDNQRPSVDPDTGDEKFAPERKALGRGKEARMDRMRNVTRHLGEDPSAMEIREALAAFEEESRRGWRSVPADR